MATPTLGNVPTTINAADSVTGWTLFTTLEADTYKQGTGSVSGIMRNDLAVGYYTAGTGISMTGQHVRCWINFMSLPYLDTYANSGMEFLISDGTNTAYWVVFGSDTFDGGWHNTIVNYDSTPSSGTKPTGNVTRWGYRFNRTAAPANKINTFVDYLRYGDGYYATGGTSGDEIDLAGIRAVDLANGYGIITRNEGVYFCYGSLTIGNGATTTWFEMLGEVLVFTDSPVASGLYKIIGTGSGCRITIDDSVIRSAGTTDATRYALDFDDANLVSLTLTDSFIVRASTTTFKSGQTVSGNTWNNCGQITQNSVAISDCIISTTTATAAILCNNPSNISGCEFISDGSSHALELTSACAGNTYTLTNLTYTGYAATNGNTGNECIYNNSGGAVTLNLSGGDVPTIRNGAGASTTVVSSVAITLTVQNESSDPIVGAQVAVYKASDNSTIIAPTTTDSSGVVTGSAAASTGAIYIRVRQSNTADSPRYYPTSTVGSIGSTAFSATITMVEDTTVT